MENITLKTTPCIHGLELLKPHWVPVFWDILWRTGEFPQMAFQETELVEMRDGEYVTLGYWYPYSDKIRKPRLIIYT